MPHPTLEVIERFREKFGDITHFGCPSTSDMPCGTLRHYLESFLIQELESAYLRGKEEGMADEAINCLEHCEQAKREVVEEIREKMESLSAFTPVDRGLCTKVSDEAKKPMFGTNYLEREAVLSSLTSLKTKE